MTQKSVRARRLRSPHPNTKQQLLNLARCMIVLAVGFLLLVISLRGAGAAGGVGDLDPSFNSSGKTTTDFFHQDDLASGVAVQSDGKIVVAGATFISDTNTDFALARYNPDGSLDTTFDSDGKVTTDFFNDIDLALGVIVQPSDGKIIAVGTAVKFVTDHYETYYALARYQTNGALDLTFGINGKVTTDVLN